MKGRPWKGTRIPFLFVCFAGWMLVLLATSVAAEMATPYELAKAQGPRVRMAKGAGEAEAAPSDLAILSEIVVERSDATSASIMVRADRALKTYESFALSDPPRVVIDIPKAQQANSAKTGTGPDSLIKRIRSSQYRDAPTKVVRLVFDLASPSLYAVESSENQLKISLGGEEKPGASAAVTAPAPPPVKAEAPRRESAPPAVGPAVEREAPPSSSEVKKVSMDFKDADISNLLRILAEVSGANIVAGADVKGNVTVRLINVPWDQAMETILKINNFGYIKEGNVYRIASLATIAKDREEIKKREAEARLAEAAARKEIFALAPLEQHILSVNYVSAEKLLENLQPLASVDPETGKPRGKLTIHSETKSIIINDTAEGIEKMKVMAGRLDIRTPQVMIEARIVAVAEDYSRSIGIQWGGSYKADVRGGTDMTVAGSNPYTMTPPAGPNTGIPSMGAPGVGSYLLNLPASPLGGGPIAGAISLAYIGSRLLLDARLSLAESQGKLTNLSSPKVTTLDNKEAEIKSGAQVPFTTIDPSSGRLTISFQEAFLRLKVKPHVTSDKKVNMEIEAENNTVGRPYPTGVGDVISIDKRMAKTEMLAENGATVVLGGLYVSQDRWVEDRVPFLGKIPVIGWLFKRRSVNPSRQELLIFITPTILEERKV